MSGASDASVPRGESRAAVVDDLEVDGLFRQAMSRLASGVVMVTCHVDDRPWGITATACCSISVRPPLLLVSLQARTVSARAIQRTRRFGVSLLGSRSVEVAQFASRVGEPKFLDDYCVPCEPDGPSGTPVVHQAAAHVDCVLAEVHAAGDHLLFIGDVRGVLLDALDRPLVYCSHAYHGLDGLGEAECG